MPFFENFDDGVFKQEFDAAFFESGQTAKLAKLDGPVKRRFMVSLSGASGGQT